MASFTDQITQFNPYIKDFSTEAYVTAGMYKQQKYDTNVAKINSYVESLYGFNVARDVDKGYLNSKVNGFTEGLNKYLSSADFSNDSIVNQVGGYAGQIANDKYIQNAVYSTAKMQKDIGTLDLAKKEGKGYSPANEYKLMQDVNRYMQGDINTSYQSEGYIPAIDAEQEIVSSWEKKHPNSRLEKKIGLDGSTGWVMVTEQGEKGISADQVMNDIEATMDPRIRKQISIDANYKLAGVDMDEFVNSQYKDYREYLDENIASLTSKALTADPVTKKLIDDELKKFGDRKTSVDDDYKKTLALSKTNPDGVKDQLYYRNWLKGTASRISYTEVSTSNLIYKDYYDIQNSYYDKLNKGLKDKPPTTPQGVMIELPISAAETQGLSLDNLKQEVVAQRDNMTNQWNDLATKLLSDQLAGVGLTAEAESVRKSNEALYFDKAGKFISPTTYNGLSPEQKKAYTKGNVSKNQVFNADRQASNIYTVKNKPLLEGLYRQLRADYENGKEVPIAVKEFFDSNLEAAIENDAKAKAVSDIENQLNIITKQEQNTPGYKEALAKEKERLAKMKPTTATGLTSSFYGSSAGLMIPEVNSSYLTKEQSRINSIVKENEKNLISNYQGVQNRREKVLDLGKPEDLTSFTQLATAVSGNLLTSGQKNFGGIPLDDIQSMLQGKDKPGTAFAYGQNPDGSSYFSVTNAGYNDGKPLRLPIDNITARGLQLYEDDPLRAAKNIMNLKGGTMGNNPLQALPIQHGGKYKASYLLDRLASGNFQLRMFIGAQGKNGQIAFTDNSKTYTEAELRQVLKSVNDDAIGVFLKHRLAVEEGKATNDPTIKPYNIMGSAVQLPTFGGAAAMPSFPGVNQQQ